ncbi:MAG: mobilization protein BmpH [Bacteroidales bacterium]|nr:mobilization protein BmpH [Bacteroidales bacterium]
MGFAVLHIQKPKGNDSGTTAHIERTVNPANADPERKYLNRNLIEYPDEVETRTQAIQHRIENAGIKRKISHSQVRALQIMLSGTPEDMHRIQAEGRLDEWCRDNIKWLQDTFGKDNVVSAVLHMDEKTPHIHATVVPIVTGERRKEREKKKREPKPEQSKPTPKKYRKKPADVVRLCADDIMTRDNLKLYQDTYAEKMAKYGLERGIKGSDARHISTPQFYRDLYAKNEDLKEEIEVLQERKEEVNEKIWDLYDRKDEVREKFLDMHDYVQKKEKEVAEMEIRLEQLRKDYEPYKAQEDLNTLLEVFPQVAENLRMVQFCKGIGLAVENIKELFTGKEVTITGKLHSSEHEKYFDVQDAKLQLYKEKKNPDKLHLSLNGQNIIDWFKEQFNKVKQTIKPHISPAAPKEKKGRGI